MRKVKRSGLGLRPLNLARQPLLDHDLPCHDVRAPSLHFLGLQFLIGSPEEEENSKSNGFEAFCES